MLTSMSGLASAFGLRRMKRFLSNIRLFVETGRLRKKLKDSAQAGFQLMIAYDAPVSL